MKPAFTDSECLKRAARRTVVDDRRAAPLYSIPMTFLTATALLLRGDLRVR
jgi:hypothetical protein